MLFTGRNTADRIYGTDEADRIYGRGGNDELDGRGGDDAIRGGTGNDGIDGGAGKDRLFGDAGGDTIHSSGDGAVDTVHGGAGDDVLFGGYGDLLYGDAGDDRFYVTGSRVTGGDGADACRVATTAIGDGQAYREIAGRTVFNDFTSGVDEVAVAGWKALADGVQAMSAAETFQALDTDGNGRIGRGDDGVSAGGGTIRIDFREAEAAFAAGRFDADRSDGFYWGSGEHSLTVVGIEAIARADWFFG
jgi:Ca2+-binding RTX toxin-like protein